jgi:hypothetical protein
VCRYLRNDLEFVAEVGEHDAVLLEGVDGEGEGQLGDDGLDKRVEHVD